MNLDKQRFFSEALQRPGTAIEYSIGQTLAELFPHSAIIETADCDFKLERYAEAGLCRLEPLNFLHNQLANNWDRVEKRRVQYIVQGWLEVSWQGRALNVVMTHIGYNTRYWIIADVREIAESFFAAVCEWEQEIRGEVLVYAGESWYKDEDLYKAIKSATFDNLVLHGTLAQDILADIRRFFAAREVYERYNIPWKRGILLVGPPGNGKTHAVKALINSLDYPCLYVKSFRSRRQTDQYSIQQVYERARETAPCIVVLEDLDTQITPQNRSFFLNELDGFAANTGILTLATTNHPEKLDSAIVERPSRFDRKYHFDLPGQAERLGYIQLWNRTLQPEMRLSEEGMSAVAEATAEYSFAYLKELFVASMMGWINQDAPQTPGTMDRIMLDQAIALREQMTTTNTEPPADEDDEDEDDDD